MKDIGGLGGACTVAEDLNNRGQIIGFSSLPGDTVAHAFVWNAATGMTDLQDPSDSSIGIAAAENAHGDIAAQVCDSVTCYAVLWRKRGRHWERTNLNPASQVAIAVSINASEQVVGIFFNADNSTSALFAEGAADSAVDLNTLIPPGSGLQLTEAAEINDLGEIAAEGPDANHNNHVVVLIPCDDNHPGVEGCDYSMVDAAAAAKVCQSGHTLPVTHVGLRTRGFGHR